MNKMNCFGIFLRILWDRNVGPTNLPRTILFTDVRPSGGKDEALNAAELFFSGRIFKSEATEKFIGDEIPKCEVVLSIVENYP